MSIHGDNCEGLIRKIGSISAMSIIDHYDIITGKPQYSHRLREERWPVSLLNFVNWFEGRVAKRRSRKHLLGLDDHLLNDIGISRDAARKEAGKGFFE